MNICIIGANGKSGKLIVKEAIERGLNVTAITRNKNISAASKTINKDLFDLTKEDIKDFDVIVNAFGVWTIDTMDLHTKAVNKLCDLISGTDKRLIIVGGAGSLYVDDDLTVMLKDTPEFPKEYKAVADATTLAYLEILKRKDAKWTYMSPPLFFDPEGPKTNNYIISGDKLTFNKNGENKGSYADFAVALVDEIINKKYIGKRIGILS